MTDQTRSGWGWLRNFGLISLISMVATGLVTAYFQHSRWYVEQRLARSAADFAAASATFNTISAELARMQALQEILFFLHDEAARNPTPEKAAFLAARGREVFGAYEAGRVNLRARMDAYIFDARRHLDWPSSEQDPDLLESNGLDRDPLGYGMLKSAKDFNCVAADSMPQSVDGKKFTSSPFKGFKVDWNSSAHHLIVFSFCFRYIHDKIENARVWATNLSLKDAPSPPLVPVKPAEQDAIMTQLHNQVHRLNGFSSLGMTQVERARRLNEPPGFLRFVVPSWP